MKLYNELAEYYYSIENTHRDIHNDVKLIQSFIKNRVNPSLLDLGCGTGDHEYLLSKSGIRCVGIDTSDNMLNVARSRCLESDFLNMDMRSFRFAERFDIIISLFGSFNYIIEDLDVDKVLCNINNVLKPNGIGLFEIWNSGPIKKIKEQPQKKVSMIKHNDTIIERERGFRILDFPDKTIVEVNYSYIFSKDELIKDTHLMRAYALDEIERILLKNDFKIKTFYANSSQEPYKETSNRIIIHFEKI